MQLRRADYRRPGGQAGHPSCKLLKIQSLKCKFAILPASGYQSSTWRPEARARSVLVPPHLGQLHSQDTQSSGASPQSLQAAEGGPGPRQASCWWWPSYSPRALGRGAQTPGPRLPWSAPVGAGAWKPTFPQAGAGLWGLAGHCSLRGQVSPNSRSRLPTGPQTPAAGGEASHRRVTTAGLGPSVSQGCPAEGSHMLLPLPLARGPVPRVEPPFCGPAPVLPASVPTPLVTRPHQPHLGPGRSVTCPQVALSLKDLLGTRPGSRQTPCWVSLGLGFTVPSAPLGVWVTGSKLSPRV